MRGNLHSGWVAHVQGADIDLSFEDKATAVLPTATGLNSTLSSLYSGMAAEDANGTPAIASVSNASEGTSHMSHHLTQHSPKRPAIPAA